jgi:4-amino-4-deoxy-L-arabinose transferase-like glycosyltransferase
MRALSAHRFGTLSNWATSAGGATVLLILGTFVLRLAFAWALGLGFDESYMVAAGRTVQWGYFDHPPVAWWMAWGAAQLAGTDAAFVVRLPFIVLFAVTTALMYHVTKMAFGAKAGFWAACLLNLMPVLGVTAGSWVLPDGPLLASLLVVVGCLQIALRSRGYAAYGWWLGVGVGGGLAVCSKYTAVLTLFGAACFLVTDTAARRWFMRPHPYLALCAALLLFTPVLVWNAQHGWISFLFQAGRAGGRFHPFGPVSTLAGEALFIIPWLWLPAMVVFVAALRVGRAEPNRWLFACLAAPPIIGFALISLRSHVLFHWASPGYMMLAPLMGRAIVIYSGRAQWARLMRIGVTGTAMFLLVALTLLGSEAKYNWMPGGLEHLTLGSDIEIVDWTSLRQELAERGLSGRSAPIVAAIKWYETGKIDYALEGSSQVICLGGDARQYGMLRDEKAQAGADVLIIAPRKTLSAIMAQFGSQFDSITLLPPATVLHNGSPALLLSLFLGHNLHVKPL